jgi:hypothetical protein
LEDELAAIRSVTGDEVSALARELLDRPLSVAVVGPYAHRRELPAQVTGMARLAGRGAARRGGLGHRAALKAPAASGRREGR